MAATTALKKLRREVFVNGLVAHPIVPVGLRWKLVSLLGIKVERCTIGPHVWFGGHSIAIGEGTYISYRCSLDNQAPISIGKRCDVGMEVSFVTSGHELGGPDRRAGQPTGEPIVIGDGVWIGARAVILQGVTVGAGAVIAAGAVVRTNVESHTLYAGVPATKIKDLPHV